MCALMGAPYPEEVPQGTEAHESPSPCRVSASLPDPQASGGSGRTTSAGPPPSLLTRSTPARAARASAAAAAQPYAAPAPHAARDGGAARAPRGAAGPGPTPRPPRRGPNRRGGAGPPARPRPAGPRGPGAPAEAAAPDQRGAADRLAARPLGGRGGGALGGCRWLGGADVPDPPPGLVTRLRPQSASRPGQGRRPGPAARDERLPVGPSRAPPCPPPRRLGSVRWPGGRARALRPVLDPPRGSARQVGERDRRRRRLAEAWALTNRLWEVASWWTGATKAVPVQSDATVMVSPVLLPLCPQVAQVVGEPVARLAVARVWRALSPSRRAVERGDGDDVGAVRAGHPPRLGLIKRWRQHHHERQHLESIIGGDPEVETGAPAGSVGRGRR